MQQQVERESEAESLPEDTQEKCSAASAAYSIFSNKTPVAQKGLSQGGVIKEIQSTFRCSSRLRE